MDILIVGKYSATCDALINKLNKEGNNVFVLMGEGYRSGKHRYVFEQYSFNYCSDSVYDVINSIKPSCVIFTGAYDEEFTWEHPESEALRYISSAMNIAMTARTLGVPRLIYLSSDAVFEKDAVHPLAENEAPNAESPRGRAIAEGEQICLGCAAEDGMKVTVLRLDHLFYRPDSKEAIRSECAELCYRATIERTLRVSKNRIRTHLYLDDAVQAVYNVVVCPACRHRIYHVTDGEAFSDYQIATLLKNYDFKIQVDDDTETTISKITFDGSRFQQEFGFRIFHAMEETLIAVYSYIKKYQNRFLSVEDKEGGWRQALKRGWHHAVPFIENVVFALIVGFCSDRFADSVYLQRLDLYLIYTVLFAVFYGKIQAIFSAFLSFSVYLAIGYFSGGILISESVFVWIAMLFILGMTVGHLRDRIITSTQDKDDEIEYLGGRLEDVNAINKSNLHIKDILKKQIISYDDSLASLYAIARELDKTNEADILFYAADVLRNLLKTDDIGIYRAVQGGFSRLMTATTPTARKLGTSVDFSFFPELYQALTERRVFLNTSLNPNLPTMVLAVYRGDEIDLVITVWNLHFDQITLYETNMLTVIGMMIHDSIIRSDSYINRLDSRKYVDCNRILSQEAFAEMEAVYRRASGCGLTESVLLKVTNRLLSVEELDRRLPELIRDNDYIGTDGEQVFVLLANAGKEEAQIVIDRMNHAGIGCEMTEVGLSEPEENKTPALTPKEKE